MEKPKEYGYSNSAPLLSIAVPTWNRALILNEALNYLIPQIDKYNNLIEFIVSDNGSEDNTTEIVDNYKKQFPQISIIYNRNQENIGFFGNFRKCRKLASGKYLWLLSDDDFVCPSIVDNIISILLQNDDFALIYLKNNLQKNLLTLKDSSTENLIQEETFLVSLISTVIFYNKKDDDEFLFQKYNKNPFIGFIFLLTSFKYKNKVKIIEGNCLLVSNAIPTGYNYFDVFINGMNEVVDYMHHLKISKNVIKKYRESYLLKFLLPIYAKFRIEKNISLGNFEVPALKTVNGWLFKCYGDMFSFWSVFYPFMISPIFVLNIILKTKRLLRKLA